MASTIILSMILYIQMASAVSLSHRQFGNSSTITAAPPSGTAVGTGNGGMTSSCGSCYWQNTVDIFTWQTVLTHTAATVLTIVDDSNNTTKTSTINVSNFTVPASLQGLETGMNNVWIYSYTGTNFAFTYPTTYAFNFGFVGYTGTLVTDTTGGMSCSTIVNSRNDAFAIPQFTDQTSLSGTAIDAENAFVSSAFPGCSAGGNYGLSFAHVAVSVLTISSSTHVGQATPAPSPVPVAQSPTIPATKTASQLAKSPPSSKPAPPESTNAAPPQSENPVPPKSANPAPPQSANGASQSSSTVPPPSINAAPPQSVKSAPPQSTNAASPQTTNAAPTRSSNAAPPQTSNATPPQSATHIVIGGTTSVLSPPPAVSPPSAPVITINSQPVQANSAGQYTADGQTLAAGSPIIVTGQAISLAPSGNAIVYGPSTQALAAPSDTAAVGPPVLTIGNSVVTAGPSSNYIITGQTLRPGSPAISVSGTAISLAPSATQVVVGSNTILAATSASSASALPTLLIGGQSIAADSKSQYVFGSQTLTPGGVITVSGTPISLAPSASQIAIGTSTIKLSSSATSSGGFGGVIMGGFSSGGTVATRSGLVTGGVITPTGVAGITGTTGAGTSAMAFTGGASGRFGAGRGVWGALVMVVVWWYLG